MDRLSLISNVLVSHFGTGLSSLELADAGISSASASQSPSPPASCPFVPCVLPLIPAYIVYLGGTAMADSPTSVPAR